MNITSKRLDKIKKTKNQSKRRIHYKNKKKNGKEKNRRKNRKYNKSTGKYRKTHKQKKRAYDLKNKSLKFKDNQPGKKPAPLKIMTTDKPVETVQTGGDPIGQVVTDELKKLIDRAKNAITGYHKKQDSKIDKLEDAIYDKITQDNKFKALFLILKIAVDGLEKAAAAPEQAYVEQTGKQIADIIAEKWYGNADADANADNVRTVINKLNRVFGGMSVDPNANYETLADIKQKFLLMIKKIQYNNDNFSTGDENEKNIMRLYKLLMRYEIQSLIKKSIGWSDLWNRKFIVDFERIIKSLKKELTQAQKDEANKQKNEAEEAEKEQRAKNIKANISTNDKFNEFLQKVKDGNSPYSKMDSGFIQLIRSVVVRELGMTTHFDFFIDGENQLTKIYDYLMNTENQQKIRNSLTDDKDELEKFNAMITSIKLARFAEAPYHPPPHNPTIMVVKPGDHSDDPAVISTDTSMPNAIDVVGDLGDLGNFTEHVEVTENVINRDKKPGAKDGYVEQKVGD